LFDDFDIFVVNLGPGYVSLGILVLELDQATTIQLCSAAGTVS
jgi:hypothetical protein